MENVKQEPCRLREESAVFSLGRLLQVNIMKSGVKPFQLVPLYGYNFFKTPFTTFLQNAFDVDRCSRVLLDFLSGLFIQYRTEQRSKHLHFFLQFYFSNLSRSTSRDFSYFLLYIYMYYI